MHTIQHTHIRNYNYIYCTHTYICNDLSKKVRMCTMYIYANNIQCTSMSIAYAYPLHLYNGNSLGSYIS